MLDNYNSSLKIDSPFWKHCKLILLSLVRKSQKFTLKTKERTTSIFTLTKGYLVLTTDWDKVYATYNLIMKMLARTKVYGFVPFKKQLPPIMLKLNCNILNFCWQNNVVLDEWKLKPTAKRLLCKTKPSKIMSKLNRNNIMLTRRLMCLWTIRTECHCLNTNLSDNL